MATDLISLTIILLLATAAPIIARLIPGNIVPEVVLLLLGGALLGQYGVGVIVVSDSIEMLSQLGLAFLFLLAGYEINPQILGGHVGRSGMITWIATFAISIALVFTVPLFATDGLNSMAVAIALCTTALGTLIPILSERGLTGTEVGDAILAYGTWGELLPILAMALLLSTRAKWQTILILGIFLALCIVLAVIPKRAQKAGSALFRFLKEKAGGSSQTGVRITALLLVALVAATVAFDLDAVLGAFAAGFILRYIIPDGNEALEYKLNAIGYGFFIPVFFVVSGVKIDLSAVAAAPALLVTFIVLLLLVRAIPVFMGLSIDPATKTISAHHRITVALYCTTALPLIVAVTNIAVSSEQMTQGTASVLVAAGAVTVFLMPLLGSLTYKIADAHPMTALRKMAQNPRKSWQILQEHREYSRLLAHEDHLERRARKGMTAAQSATAFGPQIFSSDDDSAKWREWDEALQQASAMTTGDTAQAAAAAETDDSITVTENLSSGPGEAEAEDVRRGTTINLTHDRAHDSDGTEATHDARRDSEREARARLIAHDLHRLASDPRRAALPPMSPAHIALAKRRIELARRVIEERNKRLREMGADPDAVTKNARGDQFLLPPSQS
ncbi:potassium transporter [Pseudoscardovia radai]|uniref:Potassium transporter n=1 Tax=Pseudoscardovia radai TaxID=987066 RepID=A0A261EUN7_9BIFI|nr:cation:proton antiporter [Pseudoscardovia radai]OZG50582.1 potassium transporter [Pseudoscardovia radai]